MANALRIEHRADGVAVVTWDIPDGSTNVLTPAARLEFVAIIKDLMAADQVKGIVITSAKTSFIAGADLRFLQKLHRADIATASAVLSTLRDLLRQMERGGKPVVAAMPGTALGGGLEIALACHARIAADNPAAQYGLPEVTLGLLPGAGGTQRLPRLIGIEPALQLMTKGKRLTTAEALAAGLIDRVVAQEALVDTAAQLILDGLSPVQPWDAKSPKYPGFDIESREAQGHFTQNSAAIHAETRGNYPAASAILSCVYEGMRMPFDAGLKYEFSHFVRLVISDVAQSQIRTFFFGIAEARKARGRVESGITTLGVLGAGTMGAGIAEVAAENGLSVVLLDRSLEAAQAALGRIEAGLEKRISRGRLTKDRAAALMARIKPSDNFADLAGVGAVIEAVFESREVKQDVINRTLAVTGDTVLFASNTSKIPISDLAEYSPRPDRFIGMHFFSPVPRMDLLEIIRGAKTSDQTLAEALDLAAKLRRVPIVVNDGPGFFTSRCVSTFLNEGIALLRDGVAPAVIENTALAAGMPAGPLMLADSVGLDLMLQVRWQEAADRGEPDAVTPEIAVLQVLVGQGRLGRKSGGGFYDHGPEGARIWSGLAGNWPQGEASPDVAGVRQRILHVQALEAIRCFEGGVITDPTAADIGSVLGWSFAKHTGGLCSYVDMIGARQFRDECLDLADRYGARFAPPALLMQMAETDARFHPLVRD